MTEKKMIDELINKDFLEAIGDAVSIQDTDYEILYQNKTAIEIIGRHIGKYCYKAFEGRDHVCEGCPLARSFRDGNVHKAVRENIAKKRAICVEITASPIHDSTGIIVAGMEVVRDITERKKAEDELKSKSRIVALSLSALSTSDSDGKLDFVNQAFLAIWGYDDLDEVLGTPLTAFFENSEDVIPVLESLNEHGMWTGEFTARKKDGTTFISQGLATTICDSAGKIIGYQSANLDISLRKQAETALKNAKAELEIRVRERTAELENTVAHLSDEINERKRAEESAKKFKFISDNANDAHFLSGRDAMFTYVNETACRMMGYSEDELMNLGVPAVDTLHDLSKYQELFDLAQKAIVPPLESINKRKDGSTFSSEITVTGYTIEGKSYMFAALRDITERKKAIKTIVTSERNLRKKQKDLEEKNIALKELINHIDEEKNELKEDISINIERTLMPVITELETCDDPRKYIGLLKLHLEEMQSTFGRRITDGNYNLTAREVEICNLIKGGARSKDISNILNISYVTVEKHRKNIRKKLGISSKKVNLVYFLQKL